MDSKTLVAALKSSQQFFERSTSALVESDSDFAPVPGMFSAAAVVAHVALTVDWFIDGAFERAEGFSMHFEKHDREARACRSLREARALLKASFERARSVLVEQSAESLAAPLPPGPVMGGLPRMAVVSGIEEHTAHHRGALSVYARLRGHVPPMPYMDPS